MTHKEKQFQKFIDRQLTPVCRTRLRKIGVAARMKRLSRMVADLELRRQTILNNAERIRADIARLESP